MMSFHIKSYFIIFFAFAIVLAIASHAFCAEVTVSNKITKAIVSYLAEKDPAYGSKKIEVSYRYADKIFRQLKYREGNVTFAVAELYPDFKPLGNIIVPIQVIVNDVPKEKIFLRARISVFEKIVVAKKRFKRGDIIGSTEVETEERDIAALSSSVIKNADLVIGKEVKTYIPKDNAVYDWMIKEKAVVKKNERIKILTSAENVVVEADGLSLEDGMVGAEIKVRNMMSGKELIAIVTGTGEVTVK